MSSITASVSYLNAQEATAVDEELMGSLGFSLDQLMELAGLSCAEALAEGFPLGAHRRVLVVAGPGNNGGDGLVAARHLTHFGYSVDVFYPKRPQRPIFMGLTTQLEALGLRFLTAEEFDGADLASSYNVIMDGIFGFSFKGDVRAPFDAVLPRLIDSRVPIASIDVPSGWSVDGEGPPGGLQPAMLISLTAPKHCAKHLKPDAVHYLGGRFIPPAISEKYNLVLPAYPGTRQAVRISNL